MLESVFGYEARRKRLYRKAPEGALKDFLSIPFPDPQENIDNVPILSVDFETTGLNPLRDQILSIGYIEIDSLEIKISTAYHQVISTKGDLSEDNVIIHHIMDDEKKQGEERRLVVESLLKALAGKVMLVHFGHIEKKFLETACKEIYGMSPIFPIIDTLMLAKHRLDRLKINYGSTELRLFNLRESYNLPRYSAHNALYDALATAELFFAEIARMRSKKTLTLKSVLLSIPSPLSR